MERGLIWLPLLAIFIWLAWAGWNEYQKVEAYQRWAINFERHKYDIYAVLGQKGQQLTWGKPTRRQPIDLKTVNLPDITQIKFKIDNQLIENLEHKLPSTGKNIYLELILRNDTAMNIPFTDVAIAADWYRYLSKQLSLL